MHPVAAFPGGFHTTTNGSWTDTADLGCPIKTEPDGQIAQTPTGAPPRPLVRSSELRPRPEPAAAQRERRARPQRYETCCRSVLELGPSTRLSRRPRRHH